MLNWRFEPPYVILVPTSHRQMHRLITHADAVELAFVFIYIYKQQMLWCIYWHIFYRLAWAFVAELKLNVLTNLIIYLRYYLSSI